MKYKKSKSIFVKIGLIMLLLLLGMETVVLTLSYNIIYEKKQADSEDDIRKAAKMGVQICEGINMYDPSEKARPDNTFSELCNLFDITYLYAIEPDLETKSETYLAIGFGEDATKEAKQTRYRGVHITGMLTNEEIEAYNGNTDGIILHEKTYFDDTLVCYIPCTRYLNTKTMSYVNYDNPVIIGAEISLNTVTKEFQHRFNTLAILTLSITLLIAVSFALILYFKVTKPIRRISNRMSSFVTDREKGIKKLEVKGGDELAQMSQAFNTMTDEIDTYINDIDELHRDKHTHEAELNIARDIQKGLLQPEKMTDGAFDIRAYMLAAKNVGGDLYDYRILNDGKVYIAIADVSGKGISAALFMSRAITLLQQYADAGYSPALTLQKYNNTLAANNPGGLFITTFIAIYDPATGLLTYSNAGHNIPYILSDKLVPLDQAHGVASGLFAGEEYENASVNLNAGDTLFLYTDGVNEAKDAKSNFYSTERLEKKLLSVSGNDTINPVQEVLRDLNSFTKGAVQNDDITMLSLHIHPHDIEIDLQLTSELTQFFRIKEAIFSLPVTQELKRTLVLAAEEIFVNICSYAYDTLGTVGVKINAKPGVELVFTDSGKPFDPTANVVDIEEYDHDHTIGGLGRFLAFSVADRYNYKYRNNKNTLYLYFHEVTENDNHEEA